MAPADKQHERMLTALREKTFTGLRITRFGAICYLIITVDGESHVFADERGKRKEYRHAWQVREWLETTFSIPPNSVPVEVSSR
jgi:hypothetical protein